MSATLHPAVPPAGTRAAPGLAAAAVPDGPPGDIEGPALEQRIVQEQTDLMLRAAWSSPISTFVVALFLWGLCYYLYRNPGALVWAVLIHTSQVTRFLRTLKYVRTPAAQREPQRVVRWYCRSLAITAAIWGLAPWLFFPGDSAALVSLMIMIMLGNSTAAVGALAPYRPAIYCFAAPQLLGLVAALLWQQTLIYSVMAGGIVVMLLAILRFGVLQNRFLTGSLRARYQNEALARRLAEQVETVERISREKTRFFASASHDLRQPLHSLGLFGAALLARMKNTPDEALANNLMHCVDALEASFSSMLDVSKLDAGVVAASMEPVSLADVCRRLQTSFGQQAEAQGLALRFAPGNKWVFADAALLERLLGNLVHNALKFTQAGGVAVLARTRHDQVSVEVWDTGGGIDPHELPHIFEEFYQVGNRERDRAKGLGMGLAIVRRLAQLMGMPIAVASRPGRGTVFKLSALASLPAPQPQPPVASRTGAFSALAGLQVLVVDDEENVRLATAAALALYGVQAHLADSKQQALDVARRLGSALDVLVVDFRLRNHDDGIDLVGQLRAVLGHAVPALLVTGDTAPERVRQAQESGLRVLYKPVKPHDLVTAIQAERARGDAGIGAWPEP